MAQGRAPTDAPGRKPRAPGGVQGNLPSLIQAAQGTDPRALRVMFMDEARFGRINRPVSCWAPPRVRPVIGCQIVREYTYAYTAVCPADGATCSLILPSMHTACFQAFLDVTSDRYPDELVVMICDGAGSHGAGELQIPENVRLISLPPYSPELNPVEQIWALLRERYFANKVMRCMTQVQDVLCEALNWLAQATEAMQTLTHRSWATTPAN